MRPLPPPASDAPAHVRSVAACIAAILEVDPADVPTPAGHPDPWLAWRGWLAERAVGLVPVVEPATFGWPGPWLALLRSAGGGDDLVGAVAFGVPPGLVWHPLDGLEPFEEVEAGFVLAPHDAALWAPRTTPSARTCGAVEALLVAPAAEAPMARAERVTAVAGRGLAGDRYHDGHGTFSRPHGIGLDLTLVEAEALEELTLPGGTYTPEEARRNVVTRGIDLNALVGRRFTAGGVTCVGRRLCEPCAHLQRLSRPGALRALVHRGGLRADVVDGGVIAVGDPVRVAP